MTRISESYGADWLIGIISQPLEPEAEMVSKQLETRTPLKEVRIRLWKNK